MSFKKPILNYISTITVALLLTSCSTVQTQYEEVLDQNTLSVQSYEGLYNKLEFHATILNSKMNQAILERNSKIFQWDQTQLETEQKKVEEDLNQKTNVVISFYTPEKKHDDLNRNKTLWKIFLDAEGKRYEGKAEKIKLLQSEIESLYPYHNRWSTAYKLVFPVSMKTLEGKSVKLTLTGPIGSESVEFQK